MADNSWLRYANQGATRNRPLDPRLVQALGFLPQMGVTAEVFSGGQPGKGSGLARVGSTRHDHGNAGDMFFSKGGQRLDWSNPAHLPIFQEIVRRGKEAGLTGFGAGPGYMQQGSMHVGFGKPGVWGAGGQGGNAPEWLRSAYGGARAGAMPAAQPSAPAGTIADMYAPPMAGVADPFAAPDAGVGEQPAFGGLALMFAQQQMADRKRAQEEEALAEEERRIALLTPQPRRRGVSSMFG